MCDEKTLREVFKEFDADGSGSIDLKELKAVLKAYFEAVKEPADDKKVDVLAKDIMAAIDSSGDGSISVEEFIAVFKQ